MRSAKLWVDTRNIEEVTIRTYKLGVKGHDHTDIQGIASAKLSTPYAVAAGLLYGRADLSVFEPLDEKITTWGYECNCHLHEGGAAASFRCADRLCSSDMLL